MTESDFRLAEKYIPDFKGAGFREAVLLRVTANMTGEELAKKCHMSNTVFRERFKLYRVAENNGFKSESTFSDYCKRNFNKTPLQLRKELLADTVR